MQQTDREGQKGGGGGGWHCVGYWGWLGLIVSDDAHVIEKLRLFDFGCLPDSMLDG